MDNGAAGAVVRLSVSAGKEIAGREGTQAWQLKPMARGKQLNLHTAAAVFNRPLFVRRPEGPPGRVR